MYKGIIDAGEAMDSTGKHTNQLSKSYKINGSGLDITFFAGEVIQEHIFTSIISHFLYLACVRCGIAIIKSGFTGIDGRNDFIGGITPSEDVRSRQKKNSVYKADFCISIHCNYSGNSDAKGFEIWYRQDETKRGDSLSLARLIHDEIAYIIKPKDRGIKYDDAKGMTNCTALNVKSAIIIECLFMSNLEDLKNLTDIDYLQDYAETICKGLCNYLVIPYVVEKETVAVIPQFKIQCGAYNELKYANNMLKSLQDLGYEAELTGSEKLKPYRVSVVNCGSTLEEAKNIQQELRLKGIKFSMIKN